MPTTKSAQKSVSAKKYVTKTIFTTLRVADKTSGKPSTLPTRSTQEKAEYDAGFDRGSEGRGHDRTKSFAWQRGWADGQE
jgi:hypothetical protein